MAQEDWITLADAAALSGLSRSHIQLLARTGRLQATKMGRDWFTTREAVAAYLRDDRLRSRNPRKNDPDR